MNSRLFSLACSLLLGGCAAVPPPTEPVPHVATAWLAPLPHSGSTENLNHWWGRFNDPQLASLIALAQEANPSLAAAQARRRQAEALASQAQALLSPQVQGSLQATRSRGAQGNWTASTWGSAGMAAAWELDWMGGQRAQVDAGVARAQASAAQWHDARVSLAADVALAYLALRHAQAQEEVAHLDGLLATQLEGWARQQHQAGWISASDLALRSTERAVAAATLAAQRAEVKVALQALANWVGRPVQELAVMLDTDPLPTRFALPRRELVAAPPFGVTVLPAQLLAQRPDVVALHRQWLASVAQMRSVDAERYPQLSLSGLIGEGVLRVGGGSSQGTLWSLGPTLSIPVWNAGLQSARLDAARASVDEAAALLQARWATAVGEVEDALQRLHAASTRQHEVDAAQAQWMDIARRTTAQAQAGLQSGIDRTRADRQALSAYAAALSVRFEHAQAWVRLYRTLGGGWAIDETPTS